ncbi:hypothetical protein BH10PSE19_BH10PSE19_21420 [soil metagenome]
MHDLLTKVSRIDAIDQEIKRLLKSVETYIFILEQDAKIIKAKALFTRFSTLTTKQRDLLEVLPAKLHEVAECQNQIEQLGMELGNYQQEIHSGAMGLMPQTVALGKTLNTLLESLSLTSQTTKKTPLQHLKELYDQQRTWLYQHTHKEIKIELQRYNREIALAEEWSHNHVPMKQLATIAKVDAKEIKAIYSYIRKLKQIQKRLDEIAIIWSETDPLRNKVENWQIECQIQINNRTAFLQWVRQYEEKQQNNKSTITSYFDHNPLLTSISHLPSAKKNVVISPRGTFAMMIHTPIPNIWFTESSIRINPFRDGHYRVGEYDHRLSYSKQANKLLTPVTTLFAALATDSLEKPVTLGSELDPNTPAFVSHLENLWREHFARQFAHKAILLLHLNRVLTRRDVELTIHLKGLECIRNLLRHISHKRQTQLLRSMLVFAHVMGHAAGFLTYRDHDRRFNANKYLPEIAQARVYLLKQQINFEDGHQEPLLQQQELKTLLQAQNTVDPVSSTVANVATGIERIWSRWVFAR